jgi:hypothetical protein
MEIPKRKNQRWDGALIYFTENCGAGCEFYRKIDNKNLCGWGIAFKYLVPKEKSRKCEIRNRKSVDKDRSSGYESPKNHSRKYLDKIIEKMPIELK